MRQKRLDDPPRNVSNTKCGSVKNTKRRSLKVMKRESAKNIKQKCLFAIKKFIHKIEPLGPSEVFYLNILIFVSRLKGFLVDPTLFSVQRVELLFVKEEYIYKTNIFFCFSNKGLGQSEVIAKT